MDLMDIPHTWVVLVFVGLINVLWVLTYLVKPNTRSRPPEKRNRWIESRSRSDSQ